jgi:hypothetical protein
MKRMGSRSAEVPKKKKKEKDVSSKTVIEKSATGVTEVVQHFPSKCKDLRFIILHNIWL